MRGGERLPPATTRSRVPLWNVSTPARQCVIVDLSGLPRPLRYDENDRAYADIKARNDHLGHVRFLIWVGPPESRDSSSETPR